MINIFLPGEPDTATAQEKGIKIKKSRTGRYYPQFYDKPEVKKAKSNLACMLMDHRPAAPIDGAVVVKIVWYFSRGTKPKKYINTYKATKPDLDNMSKNTLDILTKLKFWHDDGQVALLILSKYWVEDEDAGIRLIIDKAGLNDD